jgi:PIN domain nuclease of toxin-antitoxin system
MPVVKTLKQHKLVLDTHVWIWLLQGESSLCTAFRKAVTHSQKLEGVYISAISVWEIGKLVEKNKIQLEMDTLDWVEQALDMPGVKLLPISPRIAIQSSRLPGTVHGDPADQLLISTAHEHNAILVTCDEKILHYGKDRYVSVHDPR